MYKDIFIVNWNLLVVWKNVKFKGMFCLCEDIVFLRRVMLGNL